MKKVKHGPNAAADAALKFVHQQFVELFLSQNRRAQTGLLAAAGLIASLVGSHAGMESWALAWFTAVVVVTVLRMLGTRRFVEAGGVAGSLERIAVVLVINGVLMALPLLAFGQLAEVERAAYSIVLIATATASVSTTAGYRLVFMFYAAPMLVSLSVAWALAVENGGAAIAGPGLGGLIFLFLLFLVSVARQAWSVFDDSCRIRWAEKGLNAELKRALTDADEANRIKTRFLASASHDLRQPIHSINVLVAALIKRRLDARSSEIASLLDSVNQTLQCQLDGLLDISRLDAGAVRPQLELRRLDHLVTNHHATLVPVAAQRGIRCTLEGEGEPLVLTDPGLLLRVLGNLCDNALKFTGSEGTVSLGWRVDGDRAEVWVKDSGCGIAPAEHEMVFREFYQVGSPDRDHSRGLGLGLSIVQRHCALLGVSLRLQSALGEGTTMTLTMPTASEAMAATAPSSRKDLPAAMSGLTVLVVDDKKHVRDGMRFLLEEMGCRVLLADGMASAQRCAAGHPDIAVALSDLNLRDGECGIDVLRMLRTSHPGCRLTLLTGETDPERLARAHASGFPLLVKPLPEADLLAAVSPAPGH